jgi:hypothetical protein
MIFERLDLAAAALKLRVLADISNAGRAFSGGRRRMSFGLAVTFPHMTITNRRLS